MRYLLISVVMIVVVLTSISEAAVMVLQNRLIIHPEHVRSKFLVVNNSATVPVLVKVWVDTGTETQNTQEQQYPFLAVPGLLKLQPKQLYNLEILPTRLRTTLPSDRESLFWINLLEIPGEQKQTTEEYHGGAIKVGLKSQFKLIYRPFTDEDTLDNINDKLSFYINGDGVTMKNASRHVVTPSEVYLINEAGKQTPVNLGFDRDLKPFSQREYHINRTGITHYYQVKYSLLDDFSQSHSYVYKLN